MVCFEQVIIKCIKTIRVRNLKFARNLKLATSKTLVNFMKKMLFLSKNWHFSVQKALIYYTFNKSHHNSYILLVFYMWRISDMWRILDFLLYMVFSSKTACKNINIVFDKPLIERVHTTKFLGVVIDDKLSWHHHTAHVCKKLNKSLSVIYKVKNILNVNSLKHLYNALVLPYYLPPGSL